MVRALAPSVGALSSRSIAAFWSKKGSDAIASLRRVSWTNSCSRLSCCRADGGVQTASNHQTQEHDHQPRERMSAVGRQLLHRVAFRRYWRR